MYIYIVFNIIMFSSPRSKAGVYFYKPRRNIFLAASLYGTEMDGAKQRTVPPPATQGKSICGQKERVGKKSCCEGTGEDAEIWDAGRYEGGDGRMAFIQLVLKSPPW